MIFDYEILRNEYMGISGSSLLRVIQNNDMPILDLLIREAIQNSLDARLEDAKSVDVEINISKFNKQKLCNCIQPFGDRLLNKYSNDNIDTFISFSDTNTTGLTGPKNMGEVIQNNYGKFINLVFNIGKAQTLENAGGSWGYGKTVYYRVGVGLVIFYSRIKVENRFESRMIISLVEDENKTIIPSYNNEKRPKTGIMWFGRKDDIGQLNPLTNENEINEILQIFHIEPFQNDNTGTKIIIPFINEEKLLDDTNKEDIVLAWNDSLERYINVALQRWYAPRLMNPKFKENPYLKVKINDKYFIPDEDFLPLFRKIQELYNACIEENNDENIIVDNIKLMDTFLHGNEAGKIAYIKLSKEELKMNAPYNEPSPYVQITNTKYNDKDETYPIITFCRRPGMLLKYDVDGSWANNIKIDDDKYIIGLFVANSNNFVKSKELNNKEKSFEKYLRDCEKADHADWIDLSNYTILKRIQKQIKSKINNQYSNIKNEYNVSIDTQLSRELTNKLLPPIGFGKRPSVFDNSVRKNSKLKLQRELKTSLNLIDNSIIINNLNRIISKDFEIQFNLKDKNVEYEFEILSEDGNINGTRWEEEFKNKKFPIELLKIELLTNGEDDKLQYYINKKINKYLDKIEDDNIVLEKIYTRKSKIWIGWTIRLKDNSEVRKIRGRLYYKYNDRNYRGIISRVKEEINNE